MQYVTPYEYAKLCGVSSQAIYQRIAKQIIIKEQIQMPDGKLKDYIDIDKYPPKRLKKWKTIKK